MIKPFAWLSCLVFASVFINGLTSAETRTGKVTYVADGDSIFVGNWEIRLAAIDAPEQRQPYGRQARQVLLGLILGRKVRIESVATDDYGRAVAHVYRTDDGLHVNAAMVEQGAAWVYRRYTRDKSLIALETAAKQAKRGLWALPRNQRMAPEQWRREHKTARGAFDCAVRKTRCEQMGSCEEARYYATRCRAHWLDKDKDGVPCKILCRRP